MLRIESFVCTWKSWSTCKVPDPVLQAMAKAKAKGAGRGVWTSGLYQSKVF